MLGPLYLSGELDPQRRSSCDLHLGSCPACEEAFEQQRACDVRLVAALDSDVLDTSRIDIINQYVRNRIADLEPQPSRKQRWLVPGAIAASLIAAAIGIYTLIVPSAVPPSYAAAAEDHWTEVVEHQPRHWRSTPAELQVLMVRSGFSLTQAAALAAPGYWLEHAKTCGIAGRRALHLVFTNGAQQYSLYLRPNGAPKEGVRLIQRSTEAVAGFETGRFSALLVTVGTSTQCNELAHLTAARL
jgi:hypothetical protein